MTKHEDTTQAAGGSPVERGVRRWATVCLAVLDGATYDATAKIHKVTRERVRQMVSGAISRAGKNIPDRDWSFLDSIKDLRKKPEVRAAVLALLDDAPNVRANLTKGAADD